jgi:hypothetical protein
MPNPAEANSLRQTTSSQDLPLMDETMLSQLPGSLLPGYLDIVILAQVTDLYFLGEIVQAVTVFDLLGWLMSVTANPNPPATVTAATEENFHLPYLTLFARWCVVLSDACAKDRKPDIKGSSKKQDEKAVPTMVTLAYFDAHDIDKPPRATSGPSPTSHPMVFLGSTLGLSRIKHDWALPVRLRKLNRLYFVPEDPEMDPGDPSNASTAEERQVMQYGMCAETLFWIFAAHVTGRAGAGYVNLSSLSFHSLSFYVSLLFCLSKQQGAKESQNSKISPVSPWFCPASYEIGEEVGRKQNVVFDSNSVGDII